MGRIAPRCSRSRRPGRVRRGGARGGRRGTGRRRGDGPSGVRPAAAGGARSAPGTRDTSTGCGLPRPTAGPRSSSRTVGSPGPTGRTRRTRRCRPSTSIRSARRRLARSSVAATLTRRTASVSGRSPTGAHGLHSPAHRTSERYTFPRPQNTRWSSSTADRLAPGSSYASSDSMQRRRSASARHRSGPSPPSPGCRPASGRRYVSTTGALKHTAIHPSTSISTRRWRWGCCQHSSVRYRCHEPLSRMLVCRMTPSSHSTSRCRPWHSTRSMVRPARGVMPINRGASKRTIFWSTSAVRSAAAVRWMVSPSGIEAITVRVRRRAARDATV